MFSSGVFTSEFFRIKHSVIVWIDFVSYIGMIVDASKKIQISK